MAWNPGKGKNENEGGGLKLKELVKKLIRSTQAQKLQKQIGSIREYDDQLFMANMAEFLSKEAERRGFTEAEKHFFVYKLQRSLLPEFVIADHGRVILKDKHFRKIFSRFSDDNWTSFERKWNLREFLRLTKGVTGDLVECGVFRGGSAYLMCEFAAQTAKQVHLFDSFAGLSKPDAGEDFHWTEGDLRVSEEEVIANLSEFDCFHTYKGWIPERFAEVADRRFSFLHVDVDLEKPTRDSLAFFYPRLSPGGVVVLDDHGSEMCPGARRAANEYFQQSGQEVIDLATGQGLVIKR